MTRLAVGTAITIATLGSAGIASASATRETTQDVHVNAIAGPVTGAFWCELDRYKHAQTRYSWPCYDDQFGDWWYNYF